MTKHVTIWIRDDEWDRLKYKSSSSGKPLSRYMADKVMKYIKTHPKKLPELKREDVEKEEGITCGKARPLCFQENEILAFKEQAQKVGTTYGKYVLAVSLLDD